MVRASSPAASQLVFMPSSMTENRLRITPNAMASFFLDAAPPPPAGPRVRRIRASVSPSSAMFSAPAAPAPTAMHRMAMAATSGLTDPGATISPVAAVNTTSDITRGFNSWKKSSGWAVEMAAWSRSVGVTMVIFYTLILGLVPEGLHFPRNKKKGPEQSVRGPSQSFVAASADPRDRPEGRRKVGCQCSSPLTTGSSLNWCVGGGEDRVHSRVVAPSPHGLATPGRRRIAASASMIRKTTTPTAVIA